MLLNIKQLKIESDSKILVNFELQVRTSTALVGESGSGKSLTIKAILGLLPSSLKISFEYESDFELDLKNIAFIPQNPFTALSPLTKVKNQFFCEISQQIKYLEAVGLDGSVVEKFPSELSGGQLQRILIAMAISKNPKIILLDEPTTALDTTNKKNIINLISKIQEFHKCIVLFVTHDILSIEHMCEHIAIIQNGKLEEFGTTSQILKNPQNDYTKKLLQSNFKNRSFRQ